MNKTIAKVGYALLTESSDGTITYGDVVWFKTAQAGGRNVSMEPEGESNTIYADGLPIIVTNNNSGYKGSVELVSIIDDIEKDWFGNTIDSDGNILEKGGISILPRFAFLVAKETYNNSKLYEIDTYFDSTASARASRVDKTSEGNFDPEFPTYEITAKPRPDNNYVRYTTYADTLPETVPMPSTTTTTTTEGE